MDLTALWQSVLADLQLQLTKGSFKTFLAHTQLLSLEGNIALIRCSQALQVTYLETRYYDVIKKAIDGYTKQDIKLTFTVKPMEGQKQFDAPLFTTRLPMESKYLPSTNRLNPDYTFENFAVSSSNQMAYAAATAVAKSPGLSYNPLFLYGGVGVGKTHLMQAIGHQVLLKKPRTKIIYCTSEEFTNEIIEAIQTKTAHSFKKRYRLVDMLLIDDVQFIAGKNTAQEEFFHTFNAIHQMKGQIVLTSDRPTEEMIKLEDRLRSRFEGGLTIDIGQPDFELRTAILLIKAAHRGVELPIEVAKVLAQHIENPRKLEGVLIRLLTESQTKQSPIDIELASSVVKKSNGEASGKPTTTPEKVIEVVAAYYQMKLSQLKGNKRDASLSLPRQILYYILRNELQLPLMTVGELLGGRDHTTIMHGVKKVSNLLTTDEKIRADMLGIKKRIFG